jgi:tRNA threonylcarbamoyladenosine biosynthesis protein TsaE
MPGLTYRSREETDNAAISRDILAHFPDCRVFALHGELGAGKTTLVRAFCEILGVEDIVQSPTFTLVNEYSGGQGPVYHFDFYRLKRETEAYDIGVEEYFDSGYYCFVEWPGKIPALLPEKTVHIHIELHADGDRVISLTEQQTHG